VAAHSEGSGVEVDDDGTLRGRWSQGQRRQRDNDQELEEEDDGGTLWGWGRGGSVLWGRGWQQSERERDVENLLSVSRESAGLKF
jgi:hypothetical protein